MLPRDRDSQPGVNLGAIGVDLNVLPGLTLACPIMWVSLPLPAISLAVADPLSKILLIVGLLYGLDPLARLRLAIAFKDSHGCEDFALSV